MNCISTILFFIIYPFLILNNFLFGIPLSRLTEFEKFNFTKRPLNLYIPENAKHVIVINRTFEVNENSTYQNEQKYGNNSKNVSLIKPKINKTVNYRIAKQPFAIKNRGSVILLHNLTGNSLSWHQGYPSIIQMIAASGHSTVSAELIYNKPLNITTNTKLIHQIIQAENLKNITLISVDKNGLQILIDFLKNLKKLKIENFRTLIDGLLFIDTNNNWQQIEKWQIESETDGANEQKNIIPTLFINTKNNILEKTLQNITKENTAIRFLDTNKNVQLKTIDEEEKKRFQLMQIFANFFDFIHPR